jgi:uncharacterized protein
LKIVLDTNVAISGLLWGGAPNRILKWCANRSLRILECDETLHEVRQVLQYSKFSKRLSELETTGREVFAYFMNLSTYVPTPEHIPEAVKVDPFDNLFLGLASAYHASLIVSGDSHLLNVQCFEGIQIVTPSEGVGVLSGFI